jgi:hypothetical protein
MADPTTVTVDHDPWSTILDAPTILVVWSDFLLRGL